MQNNSTELKDMSFWIERIHYGQITMDEDRNRRKWEEKGHPKHFQEQRCNERVKSFSYKILKF